MPSPVSRDSSAWEEIQGAGKQGRAAAARTPPAALSPHALGRRWPPFHRTRQDAAGRPSTARTLPAAGELDLTLPHLAGRISFRLLDINNDWRLDGGRSGHSWNTLNFLNERTLKGTFFDNYKPRTDLCNVVELYMQKKAAIKRVDTKASQEFLAELKY